MAYLSETQVRQAAQAQVRVAKKDSGTVLRESVETASLTDTFDIFLYHAIRDAELVLGAKRILEQQQLSVYVDWIVDPAMDRSTVTPSTANTLRQRMRQSRSLLYLYSNNSKRSRWMPWELGYFDGCNGTVGVLPIVPDQGNLDFSQEEYVGLYPKIEIQKTGVWVNRTAQEPVYNTDIENYRLFNKWANGSEKLRM